MQEVFKGRLALSESSLVLGSLDLAVGIGLQGLVDVVGVCGVQGSLGTIVVGISLSENFLADVLVLANHLNRENVVDFNPVSRDSVLQEARGEHHVVTSKPELGVILAVEIHNVTGADETESAENHEGDEQVKGNTRVVQGTILDAEESRENGSLDGENVIDLNVEVVK
eukprot:CAMPEP_0176360624 /NCGR_PEP_ID=MMETSP0126-20121128/17210_1 /TAXON_ID=141414 ORGANISM="Strombidinopsis acuminatum, Strain SPMC142" /NCGR_SAMPLE_ID=MMETSP0126 /ASSEMBLY_ACC=CAM_ASM_000229 /LENGTH=168 /DNA_ID=CAMNT_0017715919 /DNA_START=41 /DNA_END=547 /DNA_ORIENTATION=-